MNCIINKLTLWSQDRPVGTVMHYELDSQGLIPSAVGCDVDPSPPCCAQLIEHRDEHLDRVSIGNFASLVERSVG
jgi:hypothetical protein